MVTVKNLTPSPYDIQTVNGFERLPAYGEVTAEFTGDYLQLLEASMAVQVLDAPSKPDPLDHDGARRRDGESRGCLHAPLGFFSRGGR